jgi:ribonuclease R
LAKRRRSTPADKGSTPPPRYRHPVPEHHAILTALEERGVPLTLDALATVLDAGAERSRSLLQKRLRELELDGRVLVNRRGEYCLLAKIDALTGRVSAHRDGFGFLLTEDGSEDVYLSPAEMRQLLDGDRVAVRVAGQGLRGRRAGTVVEILERGKQSVVGRYLRQHGVGYVVEAGRSPRQFVIPEHYRGGAQPDQFVKAEIIAYPGETTEAQGKVVRLLGNPEEDPAVATEAALEMFGLPVEWPAEARRAAAVWGDEVRAGDKRGREDLRSMPLVTIDGADARDFDDAVYAEPDGSGWRLLVAIADVSHYVRPRDALDEEAARRATSTYFPDRVVPMLPERLSNGLCSLNPDVDRLCMVCDMHVGESGDVRGARFYRGVMRSRQRLVYEEVQAARDGDPAALQKLRGVMQQVDHLYGVYAALSRARAHRGALDLELPEAKIELGSHGRISRITLRQRNDAHRLIEECMIAANVEAAKFLARHHLPTLYRVHAGPDEDRFESLRLMLQSLGVKVTDQARARPRELNRILAALRHRPDYGVLATAVLRTMAQAVYQPANIGHFGLALSSYAHFTSPIRRYPDLLVHRGIGHVIDRGKPAAFTYDMTAMEVLGRTSSERERRAEEAARHVEARYKCAYIRDRIGETVPGVVTAVTHFGLFVTLSDLNVDGLVHVTSLRNDYYHLQHGGLRLVGERTGTGFGLGDPVSVRIVRVNVDEAKIDLALAGEDVAPSHGARPARAGQRRRSRPRR